MAKSPTREEILSDKSTHEFGRNLITRLFWAETPEAVEACIEAGIEVNQKNLIERKTALDFCIERIVKNVKHYEDSDNKGAALALVRYGAECKSESLQLLKEKDPMFYTRLTDEHNASKLREAIKENPSLKIKELMQKSKELKLYPRTGHESHRIFPRRIVDVDYEPAKEKRNAEMIKKAAKSSESLQDVNQPENLTLATKASHDALHGLDTVTHETAHAKNFSPQREELKRKDLLNKATYLSIQEFEASFPLMVEKMTKKAKTGPVKTVWDERMFVVDQGADEYGVVKAWCEQVYKPRLEVMRKAYPEDALRSVLLSLMTDNNTKIDNSQSSFASAAEAEYIIKYYPEHIDKLTLPQLLNAYCKTEYNTDMSNSILRALKDSAERFAKGEENVPPTLQNLVTLNSNREFMDHLLTGKFDLGAHQGGTLKADFEKRIAETELKMLQGLNPEALRSYSNNVILQGSKIAEKHKDDGDFKEMFDHECLVRGIQGKTFDPRVD